MNGGGRRPNRSGGAAHRKSTAANVTPTQCPDCGAAQTDKGFIHEPTCPVWVGVNRVSDDDARWFAQYPGQSIRRRPVTPAEQAEIEMSVGWRPSGVVAIVQIKPGLRARYLSERAGGDHD